MTVDARPLASALGDLSESELESLFTAREIDPRASWRDMFDAAEALLSADSIERALHRTPAVLARALVDAGTGNVNADARGPLRQAALIDGEGRPYAAVARAVAAQPAPLPASDATATPVDSAAAAERAFTTVSAVADLVLATYERPLQRIGTGALGAAERRRLVETDLARDGEEVDVLLSLAATTGLIRPTEREWLADSAARSWLEAPTERRWTTLAEAWIAAQPAGLRGLLGTFDASVWSSAYPWDPRWATEAAERTATARALGLVDGRGVPTVWAAHTDGAAALLAHLPQEVDKVFLQNDLSAISPGPLAPALDLRLRGIARRESHAQASTYRFTEAGIQSALSRGESADSLEQFLREISLTGLPQPLHYLITQTARRHGDVIVRADAASGLTVISAATAALRDTLAVDQSLRVLGLVRQADVLASRAHRDVVAAALADARYPVTVLAADGSPEPLRRGRTAPEGNTPRRRYAELIARLRTHDGADQDAAWRERELEAAVRMRAVLEITVALPGGDERTFVLEAAGLGGGRLRGLDRGADVERTLPISHITRVRTVS